MLQLSAAVGEIDLFYWDESGFCMWTPVSYSYFCRGEPKRLEQTPRRGRRLSILGLWQPLVTFIYATTPLVVLRVKARLRCSMNKQGLPSPS